VAGGGESDGEAGGWPETLEGVRLRFKKGKHNNGWNYHGRLLVECPNADHVGCGKSRSTALQTEVFGRRAPLLFLGAWLEASRRMTEEQHRAFHPSVEEMRACRDSS
jgi:hypothetical protein